MAARRPSLLHPRLGSFGRHGGKVSPGLWTPPPRPDLSKAAPLVDTECPRCAQAFATKCAYGLTLCPRCGWLLKIEPMPGGGVSLDDVHFVVQPGHTMSDHQEQLRIGIQKVLDNWQSRGLASLQIDHITGRFGIKMPGVDSVDED